MFLLGTVNNIVITNKGGIHLSQFTSTQSTLITPQCGVRLCYKASGKDLVSLTVQHTYRIRDRREAQYICSKVDIRHRLLGKYNLSPQGTRSEINLQPVQLYKQAI